jgi:hypothetical protein
MGTAIALRWLLLPRPLLRGAVRRAGNTTGGGGAAAIHLLGRIRSGVSPTRSHPNHEIPAAARSLIYSLLTDPLILLGILPPPVEWIC